MLVDASLGAGQTYLPLIKEKALAVDCLIDTHGHWDHILDNSAFTESGIPLWIHPEDEFLLGKEQTRFMNLDIPWKVLTPAVRIREGDQIPLGHFSFFVLHTPGHSPGSLCLYEKSLKLLFSGDTLFAGTYGRTDLPGGNPKAMQQSLKRLAQLPADVQVFPGHGEATRVGQESWLKAVDRMF